MQVIKIKGTHVGNRAGGGVMKRRGIHKPTVEDVVEISGLEMLHPGGLLLTQRTAEMAGLRPSMEFLDVSSGRGTQAIYYARKFGVRVTGIDLSPVMTSTATENARLNKLHDLVTFITADSQELPFATGSFDAVVNECDVGIPDDSQQVLSEMVRVAKPNASVVIHESIWTQKLSPSEKDELVERYGTTPLEHTKWVNMFAKAGLSEIVSEAEPWSRPEMFWSIRKDCKVSHPSQMEGFFENTAPAGY